MFDALGRKLGIGSGVPTTPSGAGVVDLGIPGIERAVLVSEGSYGKVFRAAQPAFGRVVAVKLLVTAQDEAAIALFERERRMMGAVSSHPNIVTVLDGGLTRDRIPYLVMEYSEGGSLEALLKQRRLDVREAAGVGVRIARALETAHRAGIVHGDVKPANILVSAYGEPLLTDFGVARVLGATVSAAISSITTSLAHAAPELLTTGKPSVATDVYALATTVDALMRGSDGFFRGDGDRLEAIVRRIVSEPLPDPRGYGCPEPVAALLEQATSKDPSDRPASVGAFGSALEDAVHRAGFQTVTISVAFDVPHGHHDGGPVVRDVLVSPSETVSIDVAAVQNVLRPSAPAPAAAPLPPAGTPQPQRPATPAPAPAAAPHPAAAPEPPPRGSDFAPPGSGSVRPRGPSGPPSPGPSALRPSAAPPEVAEHLSPRFRWWLLPVALVLVVVGIAAVLMLGGDEDPSAAQDVATPTPEPTVAVILPTVAVASIDLCALIEGGGALSVEAPGDAPTTLVAPDGSFSACRWTGDEGQLAIIAFDAADDLPGSSDEVTAMGSQLGLTASEFVVRTIRAAASSGDRGVVVVDHRDGDIDPTDLEVTAEATGALLDSARSKTLTERTDICAQVSALAISDLVGAATSGVQPIGHDEVSACVWFGKRGLVAVLVAADEATIPPNKKSSAFLTRHGVSTLGSFSSVTTRRTTGADGAMVVVLHPKQPKKAQRTLEEVVIPEILDGLSP